MGMTPFRFAIAVCCGLTASSVLYVSQKADGSTLAEVPTAKVQAQATRSVVVKPLPAASVTAGIKPPVVVPKAPAAAARQAAKSPANKPSKANEAPAPKRIIIRHSQPGDVVFTMQGEDLQVEFRQAPTPKRRGGRS